jgi:hypothetical protein
MTMKSLPGARNVAAKAQKIYIVYINFQRSVHGHQSSSRSSIRNEETCRQGGSPKPAAVKKPAVKPATRAAAKPAAAPAGRQEGRESRQAKKTDKPVKAEKARR